LAVQSFRRNRRIRVPEVRLIDENGEQAGVVSTKDALQRAQEAGLDLVEVAPTARPPVCKILDWGKFNYEQSKKNKRDKGSSKSKSGLKELRVRPAISEHDLSYRLTDGRKFLDEGHKVLCVCIFKGRQMAHPEHGYEVMRQVSADLADISKVEMPAKMMGRRMTMLLSPLPLTQRRAAAKEREQKKRDAEIARERGEDVPAE
jgi:translation initiation factor IF-3